MHFLVRFTEDKMVYVQHLFPSLWTIGCVVLVNGLVNGPMFLFVIHNSESDQRTLHITCS